MARTERQKPTKPPRRVSAKRRYTLHEAALYLRISLRTLQRRIAAGEIRPLVDGRLRFILGAELDRANRANRTGGTP